MNKFRARISSRHLFGLPLHTCFVSHSLCDSQALGLACARFYSFSIFQSPPFVRSFVHSPIIIILVETMWNECRRVCIFTTYGWNSKHVNHIFSLKLKFPKAKLNRKKQRVAHVMAHCSQIEFDNMLFSMPFIRDFYCCYCCYVFFYLSPTLYLDHSQQTNARKKSIEFEIPEEIHAFSLGLTITNKISSHTHFFPCDEQINEQTTPSEQAGAR